MADEEYVPARRSGEQRAASFGGEIKPPEGISLWKKTEGKHSIRLVATRVGDYNAAAAPGKMFHCLRYYSHGNVGPDGTRVVCAKKTHGLGGKCAVCDLRAAMIADGEDEGITDQMAPKERCAMLVKVDGDDLQIYADSYHAFAKALDAAIDLAEDGECDMLAHHTEGARLVTGRFSESSIGKGTWTSCDTVSVAKEADPLTKSESRRAKEIVLDECLVIHDYDTVKAMLAGGVSKPAKKKSKPSDDDDDEKPAKKKSSKADDDDDAPPKRTKRPADDDDDDDAPPRKSKKSDDDDDEKPAKKSKLSDDDEDDEDAPPKRTRRQADDDEDDSPPRKSKKPTDDDDDDDSPPKRTKRKVDDDGDDEKPAKKKSSKADDDDDDW